MPEELRHSFQSIFEQLVDERYGVKAIIQPPNQTVALADGVRLQCCFHYAIRYLWDKQECFLAFRYIQSEGLVSKATCKNWGYMTQLLPSNITVCLVSDIGFDDYAVEYVRSKRLDLTGRLLLAKYSGQSAEAYVLNRQWSDYHDKRSRTGVLTSSAPCTGVVISQGETLLNPVGILSKLRIPIKEEYVFKCPYLQQDWIEGIATKVLIDLKFCEQELLETEYLSTIADAEGIKICEVDMGEDFFGEYNHEESTIRLNSRYYYDNARNRFTIAHELGHHFLHGELLERQNYQALDDQNTIEIVGASNEDARRFEYQANLFASCILLPCEMTINYALQWMISQGNRKGFVYEDSQYSISEGAFNRRNAANFISAIAQHFRVSHSAARYRLQNLNLLRVEQSVATPKIFI